MTGIFVSRLSFYGRSGAFPDPDDAALVGESLWLNELIAICMPWCGGRIAVNSRGFLEEKAAHCPINGLGARILRACSGFAPPGKTKANARPYWPPGVTRPS
jgi:hypothetical protein